MKPSKPNRFGMPSLRLPSLPQHTCAALPACSLRAGRSHAHSIHSDRNGARTKRMQGPARVASVMSSALPARRLLICERSPNQLRFSA